MHLNRFIPRDLALAALLAFTPFAVASAEEDDDAPVIEEIVVTAQKRDQSLMEVPMSVSALSADDVATMGAVNLADIQFKVPSRLSVPTPASSRPSGFEGFLLPAACCPPSVVSLTR